MPLTLPEDCNQIINCPDICRKIPDVDFSICNPVTFPGMVSEIYLTSLSHPLVNYTDSTEWAYRIALTNASPSRIITLQVIGEKPLPERNEYVGAYGKKHYSNKKHRVPFKINQLSDTNYNMMRTFEVIKKGLGWYKSSGGKTYGSSGLAVEIFMDQVIPVNSRDLENITGWVEFDQVIHPCRQSSVI